MLSVDVPGYGKLEIEYVVFDYNGTIAIDGKLIDGVREGMDELSNVLGFHVITADTFGLVQSELEGVKCRLTIIPEKDQAAYKLDYVSKLGLGRSVCVGNGRNDRRMLKEALLGVALLQEEGLASETLLASDLVFRNVMDLFACLKEPKRLVASLRS